MRSFSDVVMETALIPVKKGHREQQKKPLHDIQTDIKQYIDSAEYLGFNPIQPKPTRTVMVFQIPLK